MADEQSPSPGGEERVAETPSQTQRNEASSRGDSPSGEGTASNLAAMSREQLLEWATRQDETLKSRNRDYSASKQRALDLEKKLQDYNQQLQQIQTQYQLMQNRQSQYQRENVQRDPYAQVPQAPAPAPAPAPHPAEGFDVPAEIAQRIADASVQGDYSAVRSSLGTLGKQLYDRWTVDMNRTLTTASQQQAAVADLQSLAGTSGSDPAFGQKVLQHYAELESNPNRRILSQGAPLVPVPGTNMQLNYQLLREAIAQTKSEMAPSPAASPDSFIEPGTRTGVSGPRPPEAEGTAQIDVTRKDQVVKLLTDDERRYVDRVGGDPVKYFANLPDSVKTSRIQERKPLTARQAGVGEVVFRIE